MDRSAVARVRRGLVVGVCVGLLLAAAAAPSASAASGVTRVRVDAFAEALFGCPAFFSPAGTVCHETHVVIRREVGTSGGGPLPTPVWQIDVESYGLQFISDDPNVPPIGPIDYASGTSHDLVANFDTEHLDAASVTADVPLSDGTTADIQAVWSPTSQVQVFGNNGPGLQDLGPRHYVDTCVTVNANAHQRLRFATVTGTVDGVPFRSYSDNPFAGWLQTAQFLLIDVTHGSCT